MAHRRVAIEEVDMSVPVFGERRRSTGPDVAAGAAAEMAEAAAAAVRDRQRLALSRRQHVRRRQDFDNAMKLLAKRIATDAVRVIADRSDRHAARAGAYRTVSAAMGVLSDAYGRERERSLKLLTWATATTLAGSAGVLAWLLGV